MARKRKQKEDPHQYSLFDLFTNGQENPNDVSARNPQEGSTSQRTDGQSQPTRPDLRASQPGMGELPRSVSAGNDAQLPSSDGAQGGRSDGSYDSSESHEAESGRADLRGLHSASNRPDLGDESGQRRGRGNDLGRTGQPELVEDALGSGADRPGDRADRLRPVAGQADPVADDRRELSNGTGSSGAGLAERGGQRAGADNRAGSRRSDHRSVDANLAAVRVAVEIRDSGRLATADELETLRAYRSWGSFPQVFNEADPTYEQQRTELKELLTSDEYKSARDTITTAFYTPPAISAALWEGLRTAGFEQGRVLEPGVGTGGFVASAPDEAHMVGVERDAMSALIANALYPDAQIRNEDFADTNVADNSFDAAIGNVPFSQVKPYDAAHNRANLSTHNYFISKSIDLTAPGGYVAVVSSQHSADSAGNGKISAQQLLTDRADFITGVRLPGGPNGAFASYAGTEAGTDVLVFRVREDGQEPTDRTLEFRKKATIEDGSTSKTINAFFANHPDHVLGQWNEVSGRFGPELAVRATPDQDLGAALSEVLTRDIADAAANGYGHTASTAEDADLDAEGIILSAREEANQTLGAIRYREDSEDGSLRFEQLRLVNGVNQWKPIKVPKKYAAERAALIDLRDTTQAVLRACSNGDERELTPLRKVLNEQYDRYVETYGSPNRFTVKRPPALTQEKINERYDKLEQKWRQENPVEDRPFEGQLPDEIVDQLYDAASTNEGRERHVQLHLGHELKQDPYIWAVLALENFDEDTQTATKGPLFTSNPLRTVDTPQQVETVEDAMTVAQNHGLDMTLETFSSLLGSDDTDSIAQQLTENRYAFRHPHNPEQWVPSSVYLSGNVRAKLETARQVAENDTRFDANVAALEDVLPEKITSGITMSLGATWIPEDIYKEFIGETLGLPPGRYNDIQLANTNDAWHLKIKEQPYDNFQDADMKWGVCAANADGPYNFQNNEHANESHAGIAHRGNSSTVYSAQQCIEDVMNMTPPKLNLSKEAKENLGIHESRTEVHRRATGFAGTKADSLTDYFGKWVSQDPDRYQRLVDVYNDRFNAYVAPHYDGSYREFPGLSENFVPYSYQRNAVERMVHEPGVLLNHVVGAGKTGTMLMGAMELKRLGIAKQPWLVVPAHIVEQVGVDAKRWYPGANVLIGTPSENSSRQREDRNLLLSQAAANDWDLVIVSDNAFKAAPLSPELLENYRDEQIEQYEADLRAVAMAENPDKNHEKDIVRKREQFKQNMERRIAKARKHQGIFWDNTRADYLLIDEAHNYKNLQRVSPLRELNENGSERAQDLHMKVNHLRDRFGPYRPTVTFATGTPIANSIGELYTMTQYLAPQVLEDLNLSGVNSWAQNFTGRTTEIGFSPGGRIRSEKRIAMYENVAELAQSLSSVVDTVTRDDITVNLPELRTGKNQIVEFETGVEVQDFIRDLVFREENLPGGQDGPQIDNGLKMINDGKAASLDPRLANLPTEDGTGRVEAVTEAIFDEWKANKDNEYLDQHGEVSPNKGGLQIVFCDRGVPKPNGEFSVYDAIRQDLVAKGMDESRIRFIHEWEHDRARLWDDCNNGRVDVLIANTAKMATGANIQSRAVALHHVDVPWRPADLEQREGRILRQGNQNPFVAIYNYVGKGTYDGHSWATVERKQRFINQFWNADRNMRSILPIEADGLNAAAHNKALATGNEDFVRETELASRVERLEAAAAEHHAIAASNEKRRKQATNDIRIESNNLARLQPLVEPAQQWADSKPDERTWNFNGETQTSRDDAVQAMISSLYTVFKERNREYTPIGDIAGIPFTARFSAMDQSVVIDSPSGKVGGEIPSWIIDTTRAHSGITPEEITSKQRGLLQSLENVPRNVPQRMTAIQDRINASRTIIEEIDNAPDIDEFPDQVELDECRTELREIKARLKEFNSSNAEQQRQAEYLDRLRSKGRVPGYSLELNPTTYMREHGIRNHPASQPITPPSSVGILNRDTETPEFDFESLFSLNDIDRTPEDAVDTSLIEGDPADQNFLASPTTSPEPDMEDTNDNGDEQQDGDQMEQ